jgi:hypothetical protein
LDNYDFLLLLSHIKKPTIRVISKERSPATDTCPGGRCQGKSLPPWQGFLPPVEMTSYQYIAE